MFNVPAPVFVRLLPVAAPLIALVEVVILAGVLPMVSMVNALPPMAIPPLMVSVAPVELVA